MIDTRTCHKSNQKKTLSVIIAILAIFPARLCTAADDSSIHPAAQPLVVDLVSLPHLASGAPACPTPFLAIGRTPQFIGSPTSGGMNIQSDIGYLGGFSGFVDEATGQFGFPGYHNHSIANFAFDSEKIVVQAHVPYPFGRKVRTDAASPSDLSTDDVFEILIEPRDAQGKSKGYIYRAIGNAANLVKYDLDEPGIGQPHRPWAPAAQYATMMWDPTGSWMASLAIPFKDLGGHPADGDVWGVQFAVRYADPKITAVLSPTDTFTDSSRFARLRFDFNRRCNFRCHWLDESVKTGQFSMQNLLANGSTDPSIVEVQVHLFKAGKPIAEGSYRVTAPPLGSYSIVRNGEIHIPSHPSLASEKDTVARITAFDLSHDGVPIYDQFIPYWQPPANERAWLKVYFAKQFVFNIGPYPSKGLFDWEVDCRTLKEVAPSAAALRLVILRDGSEIRRSDLSIGKDARLTGTLDAGPMPDGAGYEITAEILDTDGKSLASRTERFTRHVMPFEQAPRAGLSDVVVPPFTPPFIKGPAISCWGRTYVHGQGGLLEHLVAAGEDILARPAAIVARTTDGKAVTLAGARPQLSTQGKGRVVYRQIFSGAGIQITAGGILDYDGFYRIHLDAAAADASHPPDIADIHLELPFKGKCATLMDAPVTWGRPGSEKRCGFIDPSRQGRLWDSRTSPLNDWQNRQSNMPPYLWIGDDDRGLCYSCESDKGTANNDALPAVTIDREGSEVVVRVSIMNRPLKLLKPRSFECALQASPFKPLPTNARLWRDESRSAGPYKNGVYFTNFTGQGCYPTYGRFLTLDALREWSKSTACDLNGVLASACSECGGTPEYQQFWHEWGSSLGWDKINLGAVPDDIRKRFEQWKIPCNGYVMVESASNCAPSNIDYRIWWFSEAAREAGIRFTYQDNATWVYYDQPALDMGYTRDDGRREPTSAVWRSRDFMKRIAQSLAEQGSARGPYVWPNIMSPAVPGRSFCRKGLTGEYTNSDEIPLGLLRVFLSKQWGIVVDWLMQAPADASRKVGTTRKYWRALCSRLFLLDLTNFSRDDTAEIARRWWHALDMFWLDDPAVAWRPYYQNPAPAETTRPSTLVSTYTAPGRALAVISNQGPDALIETVALTVGNGRLVPRSPSLPVSRSPSLPVPLSSGDLKYWYDAETLEEIEVASDGRLRLFIPGSDYRVVIGFSKPWSFAAKNAIDAPDLPAQSTVDADATLSDLCRQLLDSRTVKPVPGGHHLVETWVQKILADLPESPNCSYFDTKATASVDLGANGIHCAMIYDRKRDALIVAWYNGTDTHQVLAQSVRDRLAALAGKSSFNYVIDPVSGISEWSEIDLPPHSGRLELLYPDGRDYSRMRHGPLSVGTMMWNANRAIAARKQEMEGRS